MVSKTFSLVGFSNSGLIYLSFSFKWSGRTEAAGGGPTPVGGGMASSKKTNKYQKEEMENSEI